MVMITRTKSFKADPQSVGAVRRYTAGFFVEHELFALEPDAVLLASELGTNAVLHGVSEKFRVHITLHERMAIIGVENLACEPPQLLDPEDLAEGGRGLFLVRELAKSWGYAVREDDNVAKGTLSLLTYCIQDCSMLPQAGAAPEDWNLPPDKVAELLLGVRDRTVPAATPFAPTAA